MPNSLETLVPENPASNPMNDLVPDFKQTQTDGLRGSLFVAGQTTPERAADSIKTAETYGVDPQFAHDNLDQFKKVGAEHQIDLNNLVDQYPGVTSFFQKPENASVGKDDLPALQQIDRATKVVSGKPSFFNDLGTSVETGWNSLLKSVASYGVAHGQIDPETGAETFSNLSKETAHLKTLEPDYIAPFHEAMAASGKHLGEAFTKFEEGAGLLQHQSIEKGLRAFQEGTIESIGSLFDLTKTVAMNPKASLYEAVQQIIPFAPSLGFASVGAPLGPLGIVGGSFLGGAPIFVGQKFNELLEQKGIDPTNPEALKKAFNDPSLMTELREKADSYGVTFGALNALFGGLGGIFEKEGASLLKTGVAGALEKAAPVVKGQALQGTGLVLSQTAANVAAGEKPDLAGALQNIPLILAQGISHEAIGHLSRGRETLSPGAIDITPPEAPAPKQGEVIDVEPVQKLLPARAKYSEKPTEAIQEVANDTHQAVQTIQNLQALDEMGQAIKGSKVAKRVPDKIEELVQASGGDGHVFFQSDDWDEHWIQKQMSPAQVADELGVGKEYSEAKETGQEIAIPIAKYVSKIAPTEHFDGLLNIVKTEKNGMTFEQANKQVQEVPEVVRQIASEANVVKDEAKDISNSVYDQLIAAGRSPTEARASADLMESRLRARSSITGLSPKEHFARYGFEIANRDMKSLAQEPNKILNQGPNDIKAKAEMAGFDTSREVFHGGTTAITEFKTNPKGANKYLEGVYLTTSKNEANRYAGMAKQSGPTDIYSVYPPKNLLNLDSPAATDEAIAKMGLPPSNYKSKFKYNPEMDGLMKMRLAVEKQLRSEGKKGGKAVDKVLREKLSAAGYKGMETKNDLAIVVFDPKDIRSTSAKFENLNSKNIYAQGPHDKGGPRGQIEFGPYKALITLGEKADASTFIHEAFHLWTKEFVDDFKAIKDQENPNARQAQFLEDAKVLAAHVGADSIENLSTEQWEHIAELGEEYLRQGKAPSSALERAFARFKTWINYLYRAFRNQKVKLSDDIRQVFDRMLAPEEEIAKETIDPMFSDPATAGMTEDQAAKYTKLQVDLKNFSEAKLRSALLKDLEKQQSKEYQEQRKIIQSHVTDQVNTNPVYQTIAILKNGTQADGSQLPEGVFPMKLSKEAIIEKYGEGSYADLPKGIFDKETGLDPEFVAEVMGFDSGEEMLNQLSNAPEKNSLIEELTDQGMKELHPDLLEEPQLSNEAVKAVHNDLRTQMLRMELEHLASENLPGLKRVIRDVSRKLPTDQEIRSRAEKILSSQNIQSIRPYDYELAERKAAKEAGQLLAKGDIEGAYQAKRKELLNHELYKAAIDAQEVVDRAVEKFKKVAKRDELLAKSRDTDLVAAARALLAQNGLGKSDKAPLDYLKNALAYSPDKFQAVSDLLSSNPKNYKEMTYQEFLGLKETFDAIWSLSKSEREVELEGKKMDRDLAIEMVKQASEKFEAKKKTVGYEKTLSEFEKKKIDLMRALAAGRIVESLIDQWDRGDIEGPFRKVLFTPVNEAVEKYRDAKLPVFQKLDAILKTIAPTLKSGKIVAPELGYEFADKSFLLGALLHAGNESNLSKLLRGRGWGEVDEEGNLNRSRWDQFIARMQKEGKLTKADYDFAQSVWDLFESLKPEAQKAHKEMYGYYFNEVTANAFQTPYGEYRGGYVPARADPYESEAADIREEKAALEKHENTWAFPTTGRGFTKSRVEAYAAPLQLALNQIKSALDFELRFIHIEPGVKQTAKLLWNSEMRASMNRVSPYATKEVLIPWLQRTANQVVTVPSSSRFLDRFFKQLKTAATLQFLFLDVSNAAQQLTGLLPALLKVPGGHLRDSIFSYLQNPRKTTAKVQEKSAFMRSHTSDQLAQIEESIYEMSVNPSKVEKFNDFVKKSASLLSRNTQHVVDVSVWQAAYNHEIASSDKSIPAEVMEKNAVRAGDRAVRLTQGSGFPEHISRWATGTPGQAIFKMFMNYFNMLGNLQLSEQIQAKASGSRSRQAYAALIGFVAVSVAAKIVGSILSGNVDKNDDGNYADDLLKDGFLSILGTALSTVPGGNIVNSSIYGLTKSNPSDVRLSFSPAIAAAERGVKGLVEVKNAAQKGRALKGQEIQDLMTLLGVVSGLPLAPITRPLSYGVDVSQRRIKAPTNPLEVIRGAVTGRGKPIKR